MTLHVRDRWKEAFLSLADGKVVFLKQENSNVREMITCQDSTHHPANAQPTKMTLSNTTVRKRVEEILREHGKTLRITPIGIDPQQIAIPNQAAPT